MLKVDIIIPTCNRAESIRKTITSLLAVNCPKTCTYQIFIVENNTKDQTEHVVKELAHKSSFPIQYFFEQNAGKMPSMLKALKQSTADVIVFTDDDITFPPNWLEKIELNFSDPHLNCLTGKIVAMNDYPRPKWYSDKLSIVLGSIDLHPTRQETSYVTGASMIFRRSILNSPGLFDYPHTDFFNEDTLLSCKLTQHGYKIMYDPDLVIYHHFQDDKFDRKYFKRYYWKSGRSIAELNKEADAKEPNKLLGIPLWRFRRGLEHIWGMLINCSHPAEKFYHELQLTRFGGYLNQKWFNKHTL
jgi:glucosyl-dolichyl phosphate glucuronosyltransferase